MMQQDLSPSPRLTETQHVEDTETQEQIQLCIFELSGRLLGLSIFDVQEILEDAPITPVPTTPPFLKGVINLRGDIVPVVDVREILELPFKERTLDSRIMILNVRKTRIGILVDAISEVRQIEKRVVEKDSASTGVSDGKFISNIIQYKDGLLVLLNLDALYASIQL